MRAIDVRHMGREKVICCWEVDGVLIDPGPQSSEATLLEALGDEPPRAILLTHIHLDHAGAAGSLVRRWPDVPVYAHERGAPHLVDPSKLEASASRLYEDMDERWGEIVPVPEANVHLINDGDTVLGGYRVAYTPGHASHHVCLLHESGTAFVGDVVGVRIPPSDYTLMPTPPPDIDIEAWQESIDTVQGWAPERLALTHFGAHDEVEHVIEKARDELRRWALEAREAADGDAFLARFDADVDERVEDDALRAEYRQGSPPQLQYLGLERYWRKLGGERAA